MSWFLHPAYDREALKQRYLPKLMNRDMVTAIAMSELGVGSELQCKVLDECVQHISVGTNELIEEIIACSRV